MCASSEEQPIEGQDDVTLSEERLSVDVRQSVTGRVRVATRTDTIDQIVRQDLETMQAEVIRVPIDRTLEPEEAPPDIRVEGSVTIIPVIEEILVIERRLLLREEVHVTTRRSVEEVELPVSLRRQRAEIERLPAPTSDTTITPNSE